MITKALLPLLFLALHFNGFAQNQYKVIAVGFYNCENFFDTVKDPVKHDEEFTPGGLYHYTGEIYRQKLHNIATVIENMGIDVTPDGPAIIGLAEVENDRVLADLVEQPQIKNRHYQYTWFPTPDERGIGTALLYNPKYLKVLNAEPLHVPLESIHQKKATRDVLYVYGVLSGDTVHILVNHWPSKFGGEGASARGRMVAAQLNKRIIDSLLQTNAETKILLLGDLNDDPNSEPVKEVLKARSDISDMSLTDLYDPYINMYKKGLGTENYLGEWNLIDQIMLSGAFFSHSNCKWKYYKAGIFDKDFLVYKTGRYKGAPHRSFTSTHVWDNGYSDHFPVLVYLVEKK